MSGRLFPRNGHQVERGIRILRGVGLESLTALGPATSWGYLGLFPLATGQVGSCSLYTPLGVSTCQVKAR